MNVVFRCSQCGHDVAADFDDSTSTIDCPSCQATLQVMKNAVEGASLTRCLVCPSTDLFVRKNFPQRLGVAIVALGILVSCVTWYYHMVIATFAVFFATALLDVILYVVVGDVVQCYRCHAQFRGVLNTRSHESFDLETHERHRQEKARLADQQPQTRPPSPPAAGGR